MTSLGVSENVILMSAILELKLCRLMKLILSHVLRAQIILTLMKVDLGA